MAIIYCSHKLQGLLGASRLALADSLSPSPLGDWNGHLFSIERRKCLAFVNNKTYYSLFFADILKKDLASLQQQFESSLIEQLLLDEVVEQKDVLKVRAALGELQFARTNNDRKAIGTMNDFIFQFKVGCQWHWGGLQHIDLRELNSKVNDTPVGASRQGNRYGWPIQDMKQLITDLP